MSSANITVILLSTLAVLCFIVVSCDCKPTAQALHLESHSEQQVKGCYKHNLTLGICFDLHQGSMKLVKTSGQEIMFYEKLGSSMFYYKLIDQEFIGRGSSMFCVSGAIPRVPHELREFLAMNQTTEETPAELEALKIHYQEAINELRDVPEIQLLERLSAALSENVTQPEILRPFHALCYNLVKTSNIQTPAELRVARGFGDEISDRHGKREKRCSLSHDPRNDRCTGMCGPSCSCWSWVCGDCCFHQGCLEHDICCEKDSWSAYCLLPLGFSCENYMKC